MATILNEPGSAVLSEADRLRRRLERERRARREAETILEAKARELFDLNAHLAELNGQLEKRVSERTRALEASERQALSLANRDQLTGIANRACHMTHLTEALRRAAETGDQVALLLIDLDWFKEINDTLGHAAGDHVLVVLAQRFGQAVRGGDQVARLGGDEFAVVCRLEPEQDCSVVDRISDRMIAAANAPIPYADRPLQLSCSIGVAVYPRDASDVGDLHRFADIALYATKRAGRGGRTHFAPAMREEVEARQELMSDLTEALLNPGGGAGAIEPWWQPKVRLSDGRPVGAEALCRWRRADGSILNPGAFIAAAEENGLIGALGLAMLRRSCETARAWRAAGLLNAVSVNVSPRQLREPAFVDDVRAVLQETRLDPAALELEITENLILWDLDAAREKLAALSALGVTISLDDFGSGYSNLSALKALAVDVVKIDRAFVRDLDAAPAPGQPDPQAILSAVVQLGRALELEIVIEGVETEAQAALAAASGADLGQGYYWSKPQPAETLEPYLKAARSRR